MKVFANKTNLTHTKATWTYIAEEWRIRDECERRWYDRQRERERQFKVHTVQVGLVDLK